MSDVTYNQLSVRFCVIFCILMPRMKTLLEHVQVSTTDFKRRDMEEKLDFIVDANDDILERIVSSIPKVYCLVRQYSVVCRRMNKDFGLNVCRYYK